MSILSARQVYQLARNAGLTHGGALVATAVAKGESGWNTEAVGDTTLTDATWGPSIGLWQVRSLKGETGTGGTRDATRLKSPEYNARSMAAISSGGTNWQPWSVYTNGSYAAHLPAVRAAVGDDAAPSTGGTPYPDSVSTDPDAPGGLNPGGKLKLGDPDIGDLLGAGVDTALDGAGGLASNIVSTLTKALAPAVLIGAGVLGGFALIAVGAWRGSQGSGDA